MWIGGLLQSEVIDPTMGATFMVQRTTVGANQEMEPTGDVAYLTCGPFSCTLTAWFPPDILDCATPRFATAWDPDPGDPGRPHRQRCIRGCNKTADQHNFGATETLAPLVTMWASTV